MINYKIVSVIKLNNGHYYELILDNGEKVPYRYVCSDGEGGVIFVPESDVEERYDNAIHIDGKSIGAKIEFVDSLKGVELVYEKEEPKNEA